MTWTILNGANYKPTIFATYKMSLVVLHIPHSPSKSQSGFISSAEEAQLKRYQKFATEKDLPTFIVLGVGGIPSAPEEVFIIPIYAF
jgi:hypothetical protein